MAGTGTLALSLGLGLIAVPFVAPQAASAAARPAPKVSLSASSRSVSPGTTVRLTTKVVHASRGRVAKAGTVSLQLQGRTAWKTQLTHTIGTSGTYTFRTAPKGNARFRVLFSGGDGLRAGLSPAVLISVNSGAKVVAEAAKHKGALYLYGAAGPKRFDCSGFTMYVYRKSVGKSLPHNANAQQRYGRAVSKSAARAGDLIVIRSGSRGTHAAVYAGSGYMWDSPHSGARVSKRKIYTSNYVVRRLV
jgi:peptidoglycan DL-endopeptidase CwlO